MAGTAGLFAVVVLVYLLLGNKLKSKETRYVASLVEGTKSNNFSMEVFYQKFYIKCVKIPFLRRYILKLRRRLEIINLEDEYLTRKQSAQIMFKALLVIIPLTIVSIILTHSFSKSNHFHFYCYSFKKYYILFVIIGDVI